MIPSFIELKNNSKPKPKNQYLSKTQHSLPFVKVKIWKGHSRRSEDVDWDL
jgi:hypothetical protein